MKKFLSMALTLAMVFTMFTFAAGSASATDFNDVASDSQYKEAVDVITAIGIMGGYGNGTFGPNEYLSRGAAAKIIAGLRLTPTTAETLPRNVSPFPDVPANDEFAGYVTYVRDQGIVGGYADGTFQPRARLSGYAFLKMLLGALGYRSDVEGFSGGSWTVNVAKVAADAELLDGIEDQISSSGMTRGVATQLILNTLKADAVEYTNNGYVSVDNITVNLTNNKAVARTGTGSNSTHINSDRDDNGRQKLQFAEIYFQRLELQGDGVTDADHQDDFYRPARTWRWRNEDVGTYDIRADRTYFGNKKLSDIYRDINANTALQLKVNGAGAPAAIEDGDTNRFMVAINGQLADLTDKTMSRANTDDLTDRLTGAPINGNAASAILKDQIGDGSVMNVYYDDEDNNVIISVIVYYAGRVNNVRSATSSKDRSVDLELSTVARSKPFNVTGSSITQIVTNNFRRDDIVWYTYCGDHINDDTETRVVDMGQLEAVSGTVARYTQDSSVRLRASGSTTDYSYAKAVSFMGDMKGQVLGSESYDTDSDATVYIIRLNNSPYALWVDGEGSNNVSDYALLMSTTKEFDGTMRASILFSDGTRRTVDVYDDEIKPVPNATYPGDALGTGYVIVTATERNDGTYRINTLREGGGGDRGFSVSNVTVSGNAVRGLTDANGRTLSPDSSTNFVVRVNGSWRTYTGYRNLPTVSAATPAFTYYDGTDVKLVFITDQANVRVTSKEVTFIAGNSGSNVQVDGDDRYRVFNAVVDNRITEVLIEIGPGNTTLYIDGTNNSFNPDSQNIVCGVPQNFVTNSNTKIVRPDGTDEAAYSIIVNSTSSDTDEMIDEGAYNSATLRVERAHGYDVQNDEEIKVNTHTYTDTAGVVHNDPDGGKGFEYTWYVANDAHVYFVDKDGNIERTDLGALGSDNDSWLFYTVDISENEITNLFVVDVDD